MSLAFLPKTEVTVTAPRIPSGFYAQAQAATIRAMQKWATSSTGIGVRFEASAFSLYNYTQRSPRYQAKNSRPYFATGGFMQHVMSGANTSLSASAVSADRGWSASIQVKAFSRMKPIYLLEWGLLHQPEADAIDAAVTDALSAIEINDG